MKFTKGYLVQVSSYKNDGDAQQTINVQVETKEYVSFILDVLDKLKSKNSVTGGWGNSHRGDISLQERLEFYWMLYNKHQTVLEPMFQEYYKEDGICDDTLDAFFHDEIYDMIGYSDFYQFRVVDFYNIIKIPETVQFEDVTSEFRA